MEHEIQEHHGVSVIRALFKRRTGRGGDTTDTRTSYGTSYGNKISGNHASAERQTHETDTEPPGRLSALALYKARGK